MFCLQSATSGKHLALPVLSLAGPASRREGGTLGPLPLGSPFIGSEKGDEKDLLSLDGSEGVAGCGRTGTGGRYEIIAMVIHLRTL